MELQQDHKSRKKDAYWHNLVQGDTGIYKAEVLDRLISEHGPQTCQAMLDIGCGTAELALSYRDRFPGCRLVGMDYDQAVIDRMRARHPDAGIEWRVADIYRLDGWQERFGLVFLLDMLHEVYSFYGRDDVAVPGPIDHRRGQEAARRALAQVAAVVAPGGGIALTDNVICPEAGSFLIRLRDPARLRPVIERFVAEYPSRAIALTWLDEARFSIPAFDFCILSTQYNKLKAGQLDRWNVEKLEIHQYMTLAEFRTLFDGLGFDLHAEIGTPDAAMAEWQADFEMLSGADALPEKRITLLAIKR